MARSPLAVVLAATAISVLLAVLAPRAAANPNHENEVVFHEWWLQSAKAKGLEANVVFSAHGVQEALLIQTEVGVKWRPSYAPLRMATEFVAESSKAGFQATAKKVARQARLIGGGNWSVDDWAGEAFRVEKTPKVAFSAVCLKTLWRTPFNKILTAMRHFRTPRRVAIAAMMSQQLYTRSSNLYALDARLCELPLESGLSFVVVMPNNPLDLLELEARLAGKPSILFRLLETANVVSVRVTIPKFSIVDDSRVELNGTAVHQRACIELTEDGSKEPLPPPQGAVDPADDDSGRTALHLLAQDFLAEHAFLFFVLHLDSDIVVMNGRFVMPPKPSRSS